MRGRRFPVILRLTALCLLLCLLSACGGVPLEESLSNEDEIIGAIRSGLRDHSAEITVSFRHSQQSLDQLNALAEHWVAQALEETEDPREGDYIRYQYGGYEISSTQEPVGGGLYDYQVSIVPRYYLYLFQEEQAGEKLAEVLEGFGFTAGTGDCEKLRAIYDYICAHVSYDQIHRKNPYYNLRSTAYAGLVMGVATCQGYAVTLYRMLREAGLSCRIVTGEAGGEYHAWNIVRLDGRWYCLDATWDAGAKEYRCFLRGSKGFADHSPGEDFTGDFAEAYPLAEEDYPAP